MDFQSNKAAARPSARRRLRSASAANAPFAGEGLQANVKTMVDFVATRVSGSKVVAARGQEE
eukprot:6789355-Lingulodinium_polyedra.AAC.1